MKAKLVVSLVAILAACVAFHAFSKSSVTELRAARDTTQPHPFQRPPHTIVAAKASQLLGREILDADDRKIGRVRELAIDLLNGRIVEVVVGTGGFLGIQERDTAVPPGEFSWDPESKKLVCRLAPEQLRNAPPFNLSEWADSVAPERVRSIYHRYNATPYFIDENVRTPPVTEVKPATRLTSAALMAPTEHLGVIIRARDIIGAAVRNSEDERVGRIENVIVDIAVSRVVVLIVSTGEYLDMGDEISAIPGQAFRYDSSNKTLYLSTTKEVLRTVPHSEPNQWPKFATPDRVAMIYSAYDIPPYPNRFFSDTAEAGRESSAWSPDNQEGSASDRAITARIRQEILSHPDLSIEAQNIRIITVNGQVTLQGPVQNQDEERAIIEITRNAVARNERITNQIHTISEPPKAPADNSN